MSSETGDPRPARLSTMATRPSEPEHLPCPRCDSTNTKFCYYNNYNLSQPRHFCKSCRRYWTRGGTLRNVPVGGGSRKSSSSSSSSSSCSNKRSRTTSAANSPTATTPTASSSSDSMAQAHHHEPPLHANPVAMLPQMGSGSGPTAGHLMGCEVNLNEAVPEASSFSTLLTTTPGNMFPFGGGYGLGPGLHGLGFGLGVMDWPMETVVAGQGNGGGVGGAGVGVGVGGGDGVSDGSGAGGSSSSGCNNTWQMGSGVEGGLADGDCFGWPDLAISMPGKGLK